MTDLEKSVIRSFISATALDDRLCVLKEGIASIATSKLADIARGFVFKPHPIVVMHNLTDDKMVTFKMKRGLLSRVLIAQEEGKGDKVIAKSISASFLLGRLLSEVSKLAMQGYIEV